MLSLCSIVELLQALPIVKLDPSDLHRAITKFYAACEAAGWESIFHSKFHWLSHMPTEMAHLGGILPSCFAHERKHKTTKRYATNIQNLKVYNGSILEEIAVQDLHDMREHNYCGLPRLQHKCACSKRAWQFIQATFGNDVDSSTCFACSKALLFPAGTCSAGDIVLLQGGSSLQAAEVYHHFEVAGIVWSLLDSLTLVEYTPTTCSAKWSRNGPLVLWMTEMVRFAATWSQGKDNTVVTLIPLPLRPS